jgi:hypothetical protein
LRVVAVRDLQLLKGIAVDAAPLPVIITVAPAVHSGEDGLTEADVEIATPGISPQVRYRAVVQLGAGEVEPPVFDVPAWPLAPLPTSIDQAYRDWTFHGPLFQRVTEITGIGVDSIVGTIYSSSAIPVLADVVRPQWIIDPFVFDSALQLLLIWSRAQNDMTALPSRFRLFRRYRPLADEPLTCYVGVTSLAAGHALKNQMHFIDASGRVLAVLDAMEATCTSALNRLAGADLRNESRQ